MSRLALVIATFIIVIEVALYLMSYNSQYYSLNKLRSDLRADILEQSGIDYFTLQPKVLSDEDIGKRLNEFSQNTLIMVILSLLSLYHK